MPTNNPISSPKWAKRGVLAATIAILVFTVLEFPPPIGFETRPQSNVSSIWLVLFLAIDHCIALWRRYGVRPCWLELAERVCRSARQRSSLRASSTGCHSERLRVPNPDVSPA